MCTFEGGWGEREEGGEGREGEEWKEGERKELEESEGIMLVCI